MTRKGVLTVAPIENYSIEQPLKKKMRFAQGPLAFDDSDLKGMIQLHDDALIVAARINGFLVKRVMTVQGSGANVI